MGNPLPPSQVATVLPAEGRELLRAAIRETKDMDAFVRQKVLERAIKRVKEMYPECFNPD